MLGDIHKRQFLDDEGRVYYAGSTIQQNHGEEDDKGFSIWTINSKDDWDVEHFTLQNPRPFVTVELTRTGKIPRRATVPANARLRIVSDNNLSLDVMRKAVDVARHKFKPESISFLNRSAGKRGSVEEITDGLGMQNLRDPEVQQELISEYLKDYQVKPDVMSIIYELNSKYNQQVESKEDISRNVNWELVTFDWSNLFNYGEGNSIDFRNINGITGIFGKNFSGKSSIIDAILFTIFNTTSKNERKNVNVVNQNREWGEGKVVINIGKKVYTIHRKVEKYEKKSKGETTIEAKTHLDFSVFDPVTDETTSLNGITRNQTDANIRKHFGTIDDFLISSMSSQHGALAFINEGSTKRKEIIAKFLDLQFFDKKFKLAKDDAQASKVLMKKLQDRDYDKEIQEAQEALTACKADILKVDTAKLKLEATLQFANDNVSELSQKIANIPTEVIDIHEVQSEIKKTKNKIISLSDSIVDDGNALHRERERLTKINDLLQTLDYQSLASSLVSIEESENELQSYTQRLEVATEKKKLLEDIPCGTAYPACKFIRDAHVATAVIPETESKIEELEKLLSDLNPKIVRDHLDKYRKLEKKQIETESLIKDLQLGIERRRSALDRHNALIEELAQKQSSYNDNKEAIENLEKLLKEKKLYARESQSIEKQIESNSQKKIDLYKSLGSEEQRIEDLKQRQLEFQSIQSEYHRMICSCDVCTERNCLRHHQAEATSNQRRDCKDSIKRRRL